MKRVLTAAVVATIAVATPSYAAPKAPKPLTKTYFLHGTQPVGEVDQVPVGGAALLMDATKPAGAQAKSKQITNYIGGPNTECASNPLFPYWEGPVAGKVTGKVKITLFTLAAPGSSVRVRLFNSPGAQACNESYPAAIFDKTVTVPQGDGSVVIEGEVKKSAKPIGGALQLELSPSGTLGDTSQVRAFYDSAAQSSSVTFTCIPNAGKKTC